MLNLGTFFVIELFSVITSFSKSGCAYVRLIRRDRVVQDAHSSVSSMCLSN